MANTRPVLPLEILKFVSPPRALHRALAAVHDARTVFAVYHGPALGEVTVLDEMECRLKALVTLWTAMASNVLTRAEQALATDATGSDLARVPDDPDPQEAS